MEGMGEEQKRPQDLLSQLRSSIVSTAADEAAQKLLETLRSGIVSTRNEQSPSDPTDFVQGEEIYVEEGFERESDPEPFPFESHSVELDPDAGQVMRRRAWEDYARSV